MWLNMKIDKSKLKLGIWYEDEDGNIYRSDSFEKPDKRCTTYHVCFPLEVHEEIRGVYTNKCTCRHPLKYREITDGWIKGIKGCKCNLCGKEKVGKKYIPFALMKWSDGASDYSIMTSSIHIGGGNEDVILAMANSGDYTLSEAVCVFASACERCMNVLCYKYLNGKEEYEEFSEEWKKAGTVCDFCKDNKV